MPMFPGTPTFVGWILIHNYMSVMIKNYDVKWWLHGAVLEAFSLVKLENIDININLVKGCDANDIS